MAAPVAAAPAASSAAGSAGSAGSAGGAAQAGAAGGSAILSALISLYAQSQAKKAQQQAREDLMRGQEQAEQILTRGDAPDIMERFLTEQLRTPGLSPQELETMRFGQRRALEDAMPQARERLLQSLSQRGLLTSGIASRRFQGLEQERLRGIAGIEQMLAQQQIAQRRQDFMQAMQGLLQRRGQLAGLLSGQGGALSQISLQGGLAQAQGSQALANQLMGVSGTLAGQYFAPKQETFLEQLTAAKAAGLIK